jgi:Eukaryotic aspartyl protease
MVHGFRTTHIPRQPRGSVRVKSRHLAAPAGVSRRALRIPITNVYGEGVYTASILVGSKGQSANVMLDSGSSTLAVNKAAYDPSKDTTPPQTTTLAQVITYGSGGWAGPVLRTAVSLAGATLHDAQIALALDQKVNLFGAADGILGLAYNALDLAADTGKATYPWDYKVTDTAAGLAAFEAVLGKNPITEVDPFFSQLAGQGILADRFAFYTLGSAPRITTAHASKTAIANNIYNKGFLILGGGDEAEQADLHTGPFANVVVVHDLYYNVNLKSVRVGGQPAVPAAGLQSQFVQTVGSNAIVDSGTTSLVLAADVFAAVVHGLKTLNPQFPALLAATKPVPLSEVKLPTWPNLVLVLQGQSGDVELTVTPQTYWQVDSPAPGMATPAISGEAAGSPNQSILGLPLLNNYYTVFDRSASAGKGIIRFAPIKAPV